jgi:hypothetical protein
MLDPLAFLPSTLGAPEPLRIMPDVQGADKLYGNILNFKPIVVVK